LENKNIEIGLSKKCKNYETSIGFDPDDIKKIHDKTDLDMVAKMESTLIQETVQRINKQLENYNTIFIDSLAYKIETKHDLIKEDLDTEVDFKFTDKLVIFGRYGFE
jgi:RecA/RadA recombinase